MDELWDEKRDEVDEVDRADEVNDIDDVSPEYELEVSYDILFCELELGLLSGLFGVCDLGNSGNLKSFTLF